VAHYLSSSKPKDFVFKLSTNARASGLNLDEAEDSLPPGSLHTFLKNRTNLPGLILADHKTRYLNPFYNSVYDNATNLNYAYLNLTQSTLVAEDCIQTHVQKVATMLAKSLYTEITNASYQDATNDVADLQFIDELFYCYLQNANCRVHQAIQQLVRAFVSYQCTFICCVSGVAKTAAQLVRGGGSRVQFYYQAGGVDLGVGYGRRRRRDRQELHQRSKELREFDENEVMSVLT
jgi:hypothetical protein